MARLFYLLLLFLLTLGDFGSRHAEAQEVNGVTLVKAALLSETAKVVPGKTITVGVRLDIAKDWHVYWVNSGDSGIPTTITWELPPGWKAGPIQWPLPTRHLEPGDLVTFGYEGGSETLLMVDLTAPGEVSGPVTIKAKAAWLVCKESCIPGSADLELTLPVGETAQPGTDAALFTTFRAQLPKTEVPPFPVHWSAGEGAATLKIEDATPGRTFEFFPITPILEHVEALPDESFRIPYAPGSTHLQGVITATDSQTGERHGWIIENQQPTEAAATAPAASGSATGSGAGEGSAPGGGPGLTVPYALFLGFIGGFILNLMPCVLPVIALKIFGFLGQAGESRQRVFRIGLSFVAGIFVWFTGVALLVILAKSVGREVSWAFQFQNPVFVLAMAVIIFVFSLNLLGVFEIWLPGTGRLVNLSGQEGYGGAFVHGMFATLLATPCTAPFLGPALPFAFAQSAPVTLSMFLAIAAGMGFPYLILTAQPGWMRFLPKPGPWMERLKQLMGFLLLGTVVWLLGVVGVQKGMDGLMGAVWVLLGIGMAAWIFGSWVRPGARRSQLVVALAGIVTVIGLALLLARPAVHEGWETWSSERVAELRKEGKPIFVDFTAKWCVNCKFNENFVLNRGEVSRQLKGIPTLKADWTDGDPLITAELKRLGRAGVPVYVVYPADGGEPEILPEILTSGIVLEALERASP
ncbi:MAG TPA: thioredoxin family protein [Chthoniobacteraceae bacterium]|nr:thioredoxin family protein [Chthoniobacteraceae bacterium]